MVPGESGTDDQAGNLELYSPLLFSCRLKICPSKPRGKRRERAIERQRRQGQKGREKGTIKLHQ